MKLIDLTHTITSKIPVFQGDDPVELEQIRFLGKDGFSNFRLSTGMHVGTHVDGMMHMVPDERLISDFPLERFCGNGILIDVRGEALVLFREEFRNMIRKDDIVVFYSGWDRFFGTSNYFTDYPDLSPGLGQFLADRKVKMVAIDWPSPDHYPYEVHHILFKNNIHILENLTNLDQLLDVSQFEINAFPLKINADSSIVRAVARVN